MPKITWTGEFRGGQITVDADSMEELLKTVMSVETIPSFCGNCGSKKDVRLSYSQANGFAALCTNCMAQARSMGSQDKNVYFVRFTQENGQKDYSKQGWFGGQSKVLEAAIQATIKQNNPPSQDWKKVERPEEKPEFPSSEVHTDDDDNQEPPFDDNYDGNDTWGEPHPEMNETRNESDVSGGELLVGEKNEKFIYGDDTSQVPF
jgi:hypothetical protein